MLKKLLLLTLSLFMVGTIVLADDYGTVGPGWVVRSKGIGKGSPPDKYIVYYKDNTHELVDLKIPPEQAINKGRYNAEAWLASYYWLWYEDGKKELGYRPDAKYTVYDRIKICRQAIDMFPWNAQPWKNLASQYYYIAQTEMGDRSMQNYNTLLEKGYTWEKMQELLNK